MTNAVALQLKRSFDVGKAEGRAEALVTARERLEYCEKVLRQVDAGR